MNDLSHREYYEYLEAKHRKSRAFGLICCIAILIYASSGYFFDSTIISISKSDSRLILYLGIGLTVQSVSTWNGSDELQFLRELFR